MKPTKSDITDQISMLRQRQESADYRTWHVADRLIDVLTFHMADSDFWQHQSFIDRLIVRLGIGSCCPYSDSHHRGGEPLHGKWQHSYYELPVLGCDCERCVQISQMIEQTCRWIAGISDISPSTLYRQLLDQIYDYETT